MKTHVSHDIVLLCLKCHARSNELDFLKRASLGDQYNAPLGNENVARANLESKDRKQARSAGNALMKNYAKLPETRREQLESMLTKFFDEPSFTMELAEKASKLSIMVSKELVDIRIVNFNISFVVTLKKYNKKVNHSKDNDDEEEEFQQHGVKVVSTLQSTGLF